MTKSRTPGSDRNGRTPGSDRNGRTPGSDINGRTIDDSPVKASGSEKAGKVPDPQFTSVRKEDIDLNKFISRMLKLESGAPIAPLLAEFGILSKDSFKSFLELVLEHLSIHSVSSDSDIAKIIKALTEDTGKMPEGIGVGFIGLGAKKKDANPCSSCGSCKEECPGDITHIQEEIHKQVTGLIKRHKDRAKLRFAIRYVLNRISVADLVKGDRFYDEVTELLSMFGEE